MPADGLDAPVSDSLQSLFKVNLCEHDIKVGKILGRGSFAQVYQGLWNDNTVAIKVIEYNSNVRDAVDPLLEASLSKCAPPLATSPPVPPARLCASRRALLACRELTHPNIVSTYGFGWTDREVNSLLSVHAEASAMVILMEFCNLKSLATNISHTNRFGHHQVRARQRAHMPALCALQHCCLVNVTQRGRAGHAQVVGDRARAR